MERVSESGAASGSAPSGEATHGEKLHPRGIAPFRCLDPLRWVLDRNGII